MADLVLLATYAARAEAFVAQSLLTSEGIPVHMPDANTLTADWDPSLATGWRLLVREDLVEEALAVLRDAQLAPAADPEA